MSTPAPGRFQSLYRTAARQLLQGRADLARASVHELNVAMPQSPEVQALARSAAIIGFDWPAARGPHELVRRELPAQSTIDIVSFHVDMPRAPSGIHGAIDYMAVLSQSFESALIRAPDARRLLITDEHTRVPDTLPVHGVLRFPIDHDTLMFERMRTQQLYLHGRDSTRNSILIDSDVIVNTDPARVFVEEFDIGLTWRTEFPDAPFNGGVIFVPAGAGGPAFFARALECYEALAADSRIGALFPQSLKTWWGDQFALALVVGYRAFFEREGANAGTTDGVRVRYFPCADYNFTLEGRQYSAAELRSKFFVHFKGNRKALQAQYVDAMRRGQI